MHQNIEIKDLKLVVVVSNSGGNPGSPPANTLIIKDREKVAG
ncbi:hypothetical protein [Pseudoalteromonas luteoviolacea]|uniref:Uncharacterized protein n=1 Tax=Pseudoalteromonas luteoviolacea S4054 TaxID=1129367 RepID=A0A0F6ADA3_9GAMM|nr:hypothetical protein [Pseudoalteromonas luteoviolacea]KKE84202.1 hypothetical protein N479_09900 [Pseudoalteromonas luteoviolacea S4054]KZN76193.1 hypothetical protein N481_07515 [Pseudoalteromonas luteoviolacea S4047-1]